MEYTSSEANKLLKKLTQDYNDLLSLERQSRTFVAASGEDIESIRPEYDFDDMQERIYDAQMKIRKVKHAINVFNTSTYLSEYSMTIDEALFMIPILKERVNALLGMKNALPKLRDRTYGQGLNPTIDYKYANYDINLAASEYEAQNNILTGIQNDLEHINSTVKFNIDL